jgi:hypothetical protein
MAGLAGVKRRSWGNHGYSTVIIAHERTYQPYFQAYTAAIIKWIKQRLWGIKERKEDMPWYSEDCLSCEAIEIRDWRLVPVKQTVAV